jgi:hypothetical protein
MCETVNTFYVDINLNLMLTDDVVRISYDLVCY